MKIELSGESPCADRAPLIPVHFAFRSPEASAVYVAGSFNEWKPEATPLNRGSGGHWSKFAALCAGTYEYCLVVDEHWILDPLNKASVANPFGGRNSVLTVFHSEEATSTGAHCLPSLNGGGQHERLVEKSVDLLCAEAGVVLAGRKVAGNGRVRIR
jgi:hypothetical protein